MRDFLSQFGAITLSVAVLIPAVKWFAGTMISRWIDARFDERMKTRLANAQFDLDQQMARIQNALERDADRVRSTLSRETADFSLWAERRHDATSKLFAAFLKAESAVNGLSQFTFSPTAGQSEEYVASVVDRCPSLAGRSEEILSWHREGRHERVDAMLERELSALQTAHVIAARNAAYEAYYQSALYLSDDVDAAAIEVRDHFHTVIMPYLATSREPGEYFANKTKLRFLLLEFLNRARADLSRASRPPAIVSSAPPLPLARAESSSH